MKGSSVRYLFKEGVRNLWTNRVMAFTSIGILTTCLLIVGVAYLITVNVNSMVQFVEGQNEMVVYVVDLAKKAEDVDRVQSASSDTAGGASSQAEDLDADSSDGNQVSGVTETPPEDPAQALKYEQYRQQRLLEIEQEIKDISNVNTLTYISKEQGLENAKEMLGDDAFLLDGLQDRNYIPDSFVITVNDIDQTLNTKTKLEQITDVEVVKASVEVTDTLSYVQRTINTLGTAMILALGLISLVIISNTIRATIFARRKEINIMKFVGATNAFIRTPFFVEGFLLGLIAAFVAYLVVWGTYSYIISAFTADVSAWLNSVFDSMIPFHEVSGSLLLFFILTGTVLGSLGSVISVRNHAKV